MTPSSSQLTARHVSISLGGRAVLDDVSIGVAPGSRIGLLGPNGVGKSTLLRILAGVEHPDSGAVERSPASLTVGLLDQVPTGDAPGETLAAYLARRTGVAAAGRALDEATAAMSEDIGTIAAYTDVLDRYDRLGGHDFEARASRIAAELGFDGLGVAMDHLSGGQRTRAALASVVLARFDVLLLDEPTNNLDAEALARLEAFVRGFPGGIVVVSHDRAFLDAGVRRFVEIDGFTRRAGEFAGTWSECVAERERRREHQQQAHDAAVAERARLQQRAHEIRQEASGAEGRAKRSHEPDKFVRFGKISGAQAHAAGASKLERQLARVEVPDAPRARWSLHMDLAPATRGGDVVARLTGAVVDRGAFRLGPLDLSITRGERVALTGPNGAGKSTVLLVIAGDLALSAGTRRLGPSVVAGMLDQDRDPFVPGDDLRSMLERTTGLRGAEARRLLATFELGADDVTRPVTELSPGERTRATLALLSARHTNLLLLDEPTNHLDIAAIEQLEGALAAYDGTFVIATHDRRLLETIGVTRTIELRA
ncbi:MAG: ATP-binding cassette domain-containing protein [Actinomycetota bacterium]|nr:ATP-binding cassette domain-containing protein [Actinomycetota bacterium]